MRLLDKYVINNTAASIHDILSGITFYKNDLSSVVIGLRGELLKLGYDSLHIRVKNDNTFYVYVEYKGITGQYKLYCPFDGGDITVTKMIR